MTTLLRLTRKWQFMSMESSIHLRPKYSLRQCFSIIFFQSVPDFSDQSYGTCSYKLVIYKEVYIQNIKYFLTLQIQIRRRL